MNNYRVTVPILLLVFNRPDHTKRILERIREVRPHQLFIAADGPRNWIEHETDQCSLVRKISTDIDWDCNVQTLFQENNLGCKHAVSSAINWFFSHVNNGIILEDDCLPEHEFFKYCEDLLEYHHGDDRIMHIAGTNLNWEKYKGNNSYFFSYYSPVWGWATWKRAWEKYDVNMSSYTIDGKKIINRKFTEIKERIYRKLVYRLCYTNQLDTWDYQWNYSIITNNGMAIIPNANMVTNIGFGSDATHTTNKEFALNVNAAGKIVFPLIHPDLIQIDINNDKSYFKHITLKQTSLLKLIVRSIIPINNQIIKKILLKLGRK